VVSPAKAAVAAVAAAATTLRGQVVHWSAAPARRLLNVAVQPRRSLIEVDDAADGAAAGAPRWRRVRAACVLAFRGAACAPRACWLFAASKSVHK
jgi:hypothetical protein